MAANEEIPSWASRAPPTIVPMSTSPPAPAGEDVPDWAKKTTGAVAPPGPPPQRTVGGAAREAVGNIPSSAKHFATSMAQPVLHPIETATSFAQLGKGTLQKLGIVSGDDAERYADAVGQFLKDRYGSFDAVKNTLATDPVGLAADLSMLLSFGGSAAARGPGIVGEMGEALSTVGRAVDPVSAAVGATKLAGQGGAAAARHLTGDYLTHVGDRPIGEAFGAGQALAEGRVGGKQAAIDFQRHLRKDAPTEEVVTAARQAADAMREERGRAYRSGMVDVGQDYHILDFARVNKAFRDTEQVGIYKGVQLETPKVQEVRERMREVVDQWRGFAPAQYHTAEGFDALKRAVGYIYEETERGTPSHLVAGKIYNAVKDTITQQAPQYAKVMKGYEEASDIIREVSRELAGKPDAAIGPSLKKLQSVMRNNVHANYGNREELAQLLIDNGATNLMQMLAGQALSAWAPRGFGRAIGSADFLAGIGAALLGHPQVLAGTLMSLPFMSPRLMGEASYYAGKFYGWTGRAASEVPLPGQAARQGAFQAGRLPEAEGKERKPMKFDVMGNLISPAEANEATLRSLPESAARIERERKRQEAEAK